MFPDGSIGPREALASAIVVPVVGVVVVALVLAISLIPRMSDGQKLLDGCGPPTRPCASTAIGSGNQSDARRS